MPLLNGDSGNNDSGLTRLQREGVLLDHMAQPQPVTLLVVDDDDVDVMALQRAFRAHGVSQPIVVATDGIEALKLLRNDVVRRPYMIVLDLNMPRMSGLEFLDELRADPKHRPAVVFALTTSNNEYDRNASYERHVAGYIVKSSLSDDLKELVNLFNDYCRLVLMP